MLGSVLCYILLGIIVSSLIVVIHLVSAEMQGYRAFDYWDGAIPIIESKLTTSQLIWSMIIWPIRLVQFFALVDTFYSIYDWRKYGPRRRRRGL